MRDVIISHRARADLKSIWHYTYDRWGIDQTATYLDQLDTAIQELARIAEKGKSRESLRSSYRSIRINRHVVFYTFDAKEVLVHRVLHERMDVGRHV